MKYLCDPQIIPTVVPADFANLESTAGLVTAYADWLHVDIADGQFAPNTTWPLKDSTQLSELERIRTELPKISLEVHLMIADPTEFGARCARAGFKRIAAHLESFESGAAARTALRAWKEAGATEAGIALKVGTPLALVDEVVDACDFVHLMSISEIGTQGLPYDDAALSRVEEIHAKYPDLMVAVDGGISEATVEQFVRAGANRMCVGTALAQSEDPAKTYARIHERAMMGCNPAASVAV